MSELPRSVPDPQARINLESILRRLDALDRLGLDALAGRVAALESPPTVRVQLASAFTATNGVFTLINTWGTELWDTHGFFDAATPSRLATIPAGHGGLYSVFAHMVPPAAYAGRALFRLYKNGTPLSDERPGYAQVSSGNAPVAATFPPLVLAAGDYLEIYYLQDSGVDQVFAAGVSNHAGLIRIGNTPA